MGSLKLRPGVQPPHPLDHGAPQVSRTQAAGRLLPGEIGGQAVTTCHERSVTTCNVRSGAPRGAGGGAHRPWEEGPAQPGHPVVGGRQPVGHALLVLAAAPHAWWWISAESARFGRRGLPLLTGSAARPGGLAPPGGWRVGPSRVKAVSGGTTQAAYSTPAAAEGEVAVEDHRHAELGLAPEGRTPQNRPPWRGRAVPPRLAGRLARGAESRAGSPPEEARRTA